ncbi:sugar kinase [Actinomyces sp. Z5]|uniref:carbohydrate kinase family protein n=1 Tax=Actinomyces sp. Z5 TaxID=2250216 RepID=UPI000DCB3089|nr:sugar kinase [Actinomyces sp. Z5]RAX19069.1 sugar kinase [Actinomyces sp. Z5]
MANLDVLCVGSSVVDIPLHPVDRTVFDTVSYPVDDISMQVGGDALNESIILSRLGARVGLVTVVGDDAAGTFITTTARSEGVDVSRVHVRRSLTTSLNVGLVQPDGERTFITNRNGSLWLTEESDLDVSGRIGFAKILSFGSIFNNPLLSGAWIADLFHRAKAAGMTVCADMVPSRTGAGIEEIAEALGYVDYFFPNASEAIALTGAHDELEAATILEGYGVGNTVLKVGARGCLVHNAHITEIVPAVGRDAVDTTGAGDNFAAGYIRALLRGMSSIDAAVFANGVAGLSVTRLGATAAVRSLEQAEEFIAGIDATGT